MAARIKIHQNAPMGRSSTVPARSMRECTPLLEGPSLIYLFNYTLFVYLFIYFLYLCIFHASPSWSRDGAETTLEAGRGYGSGDTIGVYVDLRQGCNVCHLPLLQRQKLCAHRRACLYPRTSPTQVRV
jgi:hypothetical protein